MRDEFPQSVKDELAKRVGYLCSNPACRQRTCGPQSKPSGTVNIGVAAHITAASPGGPRYDPTLSPQERASAENGIWLCQNHGKLVDDDKAGYTVEKLREWKRDAEESAAHELERRMSPVTASEGVFLEAERLMPELIAELRQDVCSDESQLIREFVVRTSHKTMFCPGKPRFEFFASDNPRLQLQLDWLQEMGLIIDATPGKIGRAHV